MQSTIKNTIYILALTLVFVHCKKLISIPPPVGVVVASNVFTSDKQAASAAYNMYYSMINTTLGYANSGITLFVSLSSDELILFDQSQSDYTQFQKNSLTPLNSVINTNFWQGMYSTIYNANAIIEGLSSATTVHDSIKKELIGEAKFIRAFCNFYLVNLFGDVPLITTINYNKTSLLAKSTISDIYSQITNDLVAAQSQLSPDYSAGSGQRIIPNKWAATALLARVYLYLKDWKNAETQATAVINNTNLYSLTKDLNETFLTNSTEAIWQLQQNNTGNISYNATYVGYKFIPRDSTSKPFEYLSPQLFNAFEEGDQRKTNWIDSTKYLSTEYYYPYKYKMGITQATAGGPYTEYYMVLRLAEQYLIRAEARIQQDNLPEGAADLDIIRARAGLDNSTANTKQDLLSAIAHERQVELFSEWGDRWLDLKRTNQASTILSHIKSPWSDNAQLYPIPQTELITDPNLTQNNGY